MSLSAPAPHSPWTDEKVDALRAMWAEGHSASRIAERLGGGFSRNAVISKVHRLGLSGATKTFLSVRTGVREAVAVRPQRLRPGSQAASAFPFRQPTDQPIAKARIEALRSAPKTTPQCDGCETDGVADLPADQSPFAVTLADLKEGQCKFPLGVPGTDAFRYCGAAICHRAYCARHARLCYQLMRQPSRAETELKFRQTVRQGRIAADLANINTDQEIA